MKIERYKNGLPVKWDQIIFEGRNNCIRNGRMPDIVMIHPDHKTDIETEFLAMCFPPMDHDGKFTRFYGMRIIWSYEIEENEIIFTKNLG